MKKLLKEKFLPANYRQEAFLEYHKLSQRSSTVKDLINEFERLRMRYGAEEGEEQIVARFLGALRSDISDMVELQPYWSFNDVCQLALKVEKQLKARSRSTLSKPGPIKAEVAHNPTPVTTTNRSGPIKAEATGGSSGSAAAPTRVTKCFKCYGLGHFARDCPNKHLVTLTEDRKSVV